MLMGIASGMRATTTCHLTRGRGQYHEEVGMPGVGVEGLSCCRFAPSRGMDKRIQMQMGVAHRAMQALGIRSWECHAAGLHPAGSDECLPRIACQRLLEHWHPKNP